MKQIKLNNISERINLKKVKIIAIAVAVIVVLVALLICVEKVNAWYDKHFIQFNAPVEMKFNYSKYCSKQCHARAVIAGKYPPEIAWNKGLRVPQLAGAKNGHWKGGIATKLINWRIEVFKRDKYTCQISGKVGGRLNAHHILPCRICTELGVDKYKYDIENGVTLSRECHKKMVGREFLYIPKFLGI